LQNTKPFQAEKNREQIGGGFYINHFDK